MSHSTVSSLGERALIARITARLAMPPWVVVGPGDDAAVIRPERGAFDVLTTDAQVDGVHFDLRFVPPDAAGYRALAVNLSDLAAMGAAPRAALLSLLLPDALELDTVDRILDGVTAVAAKYRVAIVGGNITRTPGPLVLDVTAIGSVRPRRILTRAGARPGDEVYVTGTMGDAAAGLQALRSGAAIARSMHLQADPVARGVPLNADPAARTVRLQADPEGADLFVRCVHRYMYPDPRVRAGLLLGRTRAASSCMDLSDGLADAVRQMASASAVGMTIDASAIPISDAARRWHEHAGTDALHGALTGGDDYELLFTVRPNHRGRFRGAMKQFGDLEVAKIGVVTKLPEVRLRTDAGLRELPPGYEHFR